MFDSTLNSCFVLTEKDAIRKNVCSMSEKNKLGINKGVKKVLNEHSKSYQIMRTSLQDRCLTKQGLEHMPFLPAALVAMHKVLVLSGP